MEFVPIAHPEHPPPDTSRCSRWLAGEVSFFYGEGANDIMDYQTFMREALAEAKKAEEIGEVPIGAVVVRNGEVIGRGHNLRETTHDPTAHAEIIAIREAAGAVGGWRLNDCDLYVTLEPCPMCAGAILQARIANVIYGTADPKAGCAGTLMNLLDDGRFNHQTAVVTDVLQEECAALLSDFFRRLRQKRKLEKEAARNRTNE
jgi:tRNA(adenine34) deaminase